MKLLSSACAPLHERIILLAPFSSRIPEVFGNVSVSSPDHERLLAQMQRLRGNVYLEDGAIEPWQLTADGRHRQMADEKSWHLLALDGEGEVCGCVRYRQHETSTSFERLGVHNSAMAQCDKWGMKLRSAVEQELGRRGRRTFLTRR